MWGFYNQRNRGLGKKIFNKMMNPTVASKYHQSGTRTKRGPDQHFLTDHVYPLIKSRSVIHDSYLCARYKDSKPFPTERVGYCYIAVHHFYEGSCLTNKSNLGPECPMKCQSAEHRDWKYC
jgi:hypothetical protein